MHWPARFTVLVDKVSREMAEFPVLEATVGVGDDPAPDAVVTGKAHSPEGAASVALRNLLTGERGGVFVDVFCYLAVGLGLLAIAAVIAFFIGGMFVL